MVKEKLSLPPIYCVCPCRVFM